MDISNILIFGIGAPALIFAVIEGLKAVGLVSTGDQARIANFVLAAFIGVIAAADSEFNLIAQLGLSETVMQVVEILFVGVYNAVVAALGYNLSPASRS